MTDNPEQLTCISIIVCDDVFRDERTRKLVVVGTFNAITTEKLPCEHPSFRVLMTLTNARGSYDLSVSIEHEASGEDILELSGPFTCDNPLGVIDVDVEIRGLRFPSDGKYWVKVQSEQRLLQQRPILVLRDEHLTENRDAPSHDQA